jgi:hypothetical protein
MGIPRTTVRVNLQSDVNVESLNEIISTITGRYGCRTCGLMGIDLYLSGDPGDLSQIQGLSGVQSVALE